MGSVIQFSYHGIKSAEAIQEHFKANSLETATLESASNSQLLIDICQ